MPEVEINRESLRLGGGGFDFLSFLPPAELFVEWSEFVLGEGDIEREFRIWKRPLVEW